jgi:MFS family permease
VAFSAIAVGNFMATLDGNIVNVALPSMARDLVAPVGSVQWVVSAYLLAITGTLLPMGRLGDRLGLRAVYAGGLAVFTAGSALCGLAPGLRELVGARVIQAIGASAMMAIAPAVVTAAFPPERRGRALGAVGTVVALGLTAGPPIGGLILAHASWHWVFLVNVPVGIAGVAWALRVLERGGGQRGGPLLDLSVFAIPVFRWGIVAGFFSYAAMFTQTLLTPFYLSHVLGLGPGALGLALASVPIALSVASPVAGILTDRLGTRTLPFAGMALLVAGLWGLSLAGPQDGVLSVALRLGVCGAGMGLFQSPNNVAVMGALPRHRLGSGGGILATARNAGMAGGVSLSGLLFALSTGGLEERFLEGYAIALRAGAVLAVGAAAASLVRRRSA